jgi:hypothetical protein
MLFVDLFRRRVLVVCWLAFIFNFLAILILAPLYIRILRLFLRNLRQNYIDQTFTLSFLSRLALPFLSMLLFLHLFFELFDKIPNQLKIFLRLPGTFLLRIPLPLNLILGFFCLEAEVLVTALILFARILSTSYILMLLWRQKIL